MLGTGDFFRDGRRKREFGLVWRLKAALLLTAAAAAVTPSNGGLSVDGEIHSIGFDLDQFACCAFLSLAFFNEEESR